MFNDNTAQESQLLGVSVCCEAEGSGQEKGRGRLTYIQKARYICNIHLNSDRFINGYQIQNSLVNR